MTTEYTEMLGAYALGALDEPEQKAVPGLRSSDAAAGTMAQWARVITGMAYSLAQVPPPSRLKDRVLAALAAEDAGEIANRTAAPQPGVQVWKKWSAPGSRTDLYLQRAQEGEWEATAVPGVEVKKLFVDQSRSYVTMLVRMVAGTSYPGHRHAGFEECYVLQGDLHVGDTVLRAGDYQRAEGGSTHGIQSTAGGCLLFIVSSLADELIP